MICGKTSQLVLNNEADTSLNSFEEGEVKFLHEEDVPDVRVHLRRVEVTELMGNEVIVYLNSKGKSMLARVDPRTQARVGNTIKVALNMDVFHIFDKQTEKAVR